MSLAAQNRLVSSLSEQELMAIGTLLAKVWPKPDKGPVERAAKLKAFADDYEGPAELAPVSVVVCQHDQVLAHSLTFERQIQTSQGGLGVLALAMVASDPDRRGDGLGSAIVKASFARVDSGDFPLSLFQTSHEVQGFYERLGCHRITNPIVNSTNQADPTRNPFWDDIAMIYPGKFEWPEGQVDLCGPGY